MTVFQIETELKDKLLEGLKDKNKRDEWDNIQTSVSILILCIKGFNLNFCCNPGPDYIFFWV